MKADTGAYIVKATCASCQIERVVSKYRLKAPYLCRRCAASRTGQRTWAANSPFKTTHGMRRTRLYGIWCGMKQRCQNRNNDSYKTYGARGITVCDAWQNFEAFKNWALASGYKAGLEIDRIDNDLGYAPDNCGWVSKTENRKKRSNVRMNQEQAEQVRALHRLGFKQTDIAANFGVSPQTVNNIVKGKQWRPSRV